MNVDKEPAPLSQLPKKARFSRASRACTECRHRKTRCDGKLPCHACKEFDRPCAHTSTKSQRPTGASRTKILEDRLRRARALIIKLQKQDLSPQSQAIFDDISHSHGSPEPADAISPTTHEIDSSEGGLENMMDGREHLAAADGESFDYFGAASGFAFLHRTKQLFEDGKQDYIDAHLELSRLFDSPLPNKKAFDDAGVSLSHLLPSRETATRLAHVVFRQTYPLFQFLHEATFQKQTDRIFNVDSMNFTDADHNFVPLFYSTMAIGYLVDKQSHQSYGCENAVGQAMRNFIAAKQMVDMSTCRELVCLQTIVCLILFLLSTARIATAHTLVGLAVAASMRMGLHSQTSSYDMSNLQRDMRRRVFWTIVQLDILSRTVLGLPELVNLSHVNQPRPSRAISEYHCPGQDDTTSKESARLFAASAQYLDLLILFAKIKPYVYPNTEGKASQMKPGGKQVISSAVIAELEKEFKNWRDQLQDALDANDQPQSPELTSIMYELEMVHNWAHIILYRPFLHYLARKNTETPPDNRQLRCAVSCVKIARVTISRSEQMLRQGFLVPASWPSVNTIFFCVVALIFFLATQHGDKEYERIQQETELGIRILAATCCQAIGRRRYLEALKVLITKLSPVEKLDIQSIEQSVSSLCKSESTRTSQENIPWPSRAFSNQDSSLSWSNTVPITLSDAHSSSLAFTRPESFQLTPLNWNMQPDQAQPLYPADPFSSYESHPGHGPANLHPQFASTLSSFPGPALEGDQFQIEKMEVPWAEFFAWPGDSVSKNNEGASQFSQGGEHPVDRSDLVIPEDIAALMGINPGGDAFI